MLKTDISDVSKKNFENLVKNISIYKTVFESNYINDLRISSEASASLINLQTTSQFDNLQFVLDNISHNFIKLFFKIFNIFDTYNFKSISSVNSKRNSAIKQNNYELVASVNLLDHSVAVMKNAHALCTQNNLPQHLVDIVCFIALTHDAGKCHEISQMYSDQIEKIKMKSANKDLNLHHLVSAFFIKDFILQHNQAEMHRSLKISDEISKLIYYELSIHHEEVAEQSILQKLLRKADALTRNQELEKAKNSESRK